jgi:xanthine dehydrogenase accessory factor
MAITASNFPILIRGGGEMASGIAHRLHQCHMKVLICEIAAPTTVRRSVAYADAVFKGRQTIEGVEAIKVPTIADAQEAWSRGAIPLLIDPDTVRGKAFKPVVLVDAIMAKRDSSTKLTDAPLVIGVGPGFIAGQNVHAVVESNRGYHLGRVIWQGGAEPDTGVPAPVAGHTEARVFRAPRDGRFNAQRQIGELVSAGEIVGEIAGEPVRAAIAGLIRGMLHDGVEIQAGMKLGDIDPRGEREYVDSISDKARAIGGGVLEAILHSYPSLKFPA